jgi:hypothetical protein
MARMEGTLTSVAEKIEKRPTWEDLNRIEANRDGTELIQNEAIKALQDNNKWLVRTAGAALVTGVLSAPIAIAVAVATR